MNRKILIITSIGHFLCHAVTLIFPAILILIRDEFNITLVELGFLGTIQFLFFGIASYPAGWLSDRLGSRFVLNLYFIGLILSIIIIFNSNTLWFLALGIGLLGLSAGLYHPAGLKFISITNLVPRYMSYHGIAGSIGLTTGPLFGAVISVITDWRWAYFIMGIIAIIGLMINSLIIVNDSPNEKPKTFFPHLTSAHYLIFFVGVFWGFAHQGLFYFLPIYFSEVVKWEFEAVLKGGVLTSLVLIIGVIGQLAGGKFGEKFPRENLLVWVVGLNIPFFLLMGFLSDWTLVGIVIILGAVNFSYQPVNNSLLSDITPIKNRGMVYGISNGLGFGVGSLAGTVGGFIGEYLSLNLIFPILGIMLFPTIFLCICVRKTVKIL